jgi:hypothetical protein
MWSTAEVIAVLRNHRQTCAKIMIIENALQEDRIGARSRMIMDVKLVPPYVTT